MKQALSLFSFAMQWQHGRCYLCACRMRTDVDEANLARATRDHVRPVSAGGIKRGNIALACTRCNRARANRAPTACQIMFAVELRRAWDIDDDFRHQVYFVRYIQSIVQRQLVGGPERKRSGHKIGVQKPGPMEIAFERAEAQRQRARAA